VCINDDHVKGRKGEISVMWYWNSVRNDTAINFADIAKFCSEFDMFFVNYWMENWRNNVANVFMEDVFKNVCCFHSEEVENV
jgi:hypothetical protein